MNRRGLAGPASALALLREDDREMVEERIAIMTADGIPETYARTYAERRADETRDRRRRLLVASVSRCA